MSAQCASPRRNPREATTDQISSLRPSRSSGSSVSAATSALQGAAPQGPPGPQIQDRRGSRGSAPRCAGLQGLRGRSRVDRGTGVFGAECALGGRSRAIDRGDYDPPPTVAGDRCGGFWQPLAWFSLQNCRVFPLKGVDMRCRNCRGQLEDSLPVGNPSVPGEQHETLDSLAPVREDVGRHGKHDPRRHSRGHLPGRPRRGRPRRPEELCSTVAASRRTTD